jgi:hypothetical protein
MLSEVKRRPSKRVTRAMVDERMDRTLSLIETFAVQDAGTGCAGVTS